MKTQPTFFQPAEEPTVRRDSLVVAYHPTLREVGHSILDAGGNAFDAFVAVVAAQNVIAEGASTLAGPLGVLLYTGRQGHVVYLDADLNDPVDPAWRWHPRMPRDGRAILVPGAPAGLEAIAENYGSRPFAELLQPAIHLAQEGFPVTKLMTSFIGWRAKMLQRSDYGRETFFHRRKPFRPGDTLRLPEVADFLSNLAREGSRYVYSGEWGRRFLETVRRKHGVLTEEDLAHYRVQWQAPWSATYHGHTVHACSGRAYGGLWTLLALKALEHAPPQGASHYSEDPDALETLVRVARQVWAEGWLLDYTALDNRELVASRLVPAHTKQIWDRVRERAPLKSLKPASHSYHIIVVDRHGNAASGTTTIESDPWGEGMFVQGIPLAPAGAIPWNTAPGQRRLSPFSMHFVFEQERLRFSAGAISNSAVEAAFQFLVNLIDYELPLPDAVSAPRFGTFPAHRKLEIDKNWLDPRVGKSIVNALKKRGLKFEQKGLLDTGLGTLLKAEPGRLAGVAAPVPYIAEPFRSEP